MKSSKPSSERMLFRSCMVRYAPVWVLYSVGCALLVLLVLGGGQADYQRAQSVVTLIRGLGAANMLYALAITQVLFGYLMEPRQCYGIHAMPVTRDWLFRITTLTGLVFFAVPCLVLTVSAALTLRELAYLTGWIVLANVLQFVFFYGAAVLSVFLSGNRIAMALIYVIIGFAGLLAAWFVKRFYEPMLFGVTLDVGHIRASSPAFAMTSWRYLNVDISYDPVTYDNYLKGVSLDWGWRGLAAYAAMGVACFPISQILYRRRQLECAGDFLAVDRLKWGFLAMFTMAAGCACYIVADNFRGTVAMIFLPVGMIAGYFVGLMLLRRQTNVFRWKVLVPLGLMMLTLLLTAAACLGDIAGIVSKIPNPADVESVELTDYSNYLEPVITLTDPEDIEVVRQLHAEALGIHEDRVMEDFRERSDGYSVSGDVSYGLTLTYNLKDGRKLSRNYSIPAESPNLIPLRRILSRPEYVLGVADEEVPELAQRVERCNVQLYGEEFSRNYEIEDVAGLLEALRADCREGTAVQNWALHENSETNLGYLELRVTDTENPANLNYISYSIRPCNKNLVSWLTAHGCHIELPAEETDTAMAE